MRAENRVLLARLGQKRLRFADAERRLLADKGKPLGRKLLADVASLATPETILRWYREQVAAKYDGSRTHGGPGRPANRSDKVQQLLTMARENPSWGYAHDHAERNHQGLGNVIPFPSLDSVTAVGRVGRRQRLGGVLSFYEREAA